MSYGALSKEAKMALALSSSLAGKLPGTKVTAEIAAVRQIPQGKMAQSPAVHQDIKNAKDLSAKILELRNLTGGKPISLKFVGGHLENDLEAVFSQANIPDVLVIDGGEGGTGAAPVTVKDHVGLPLIYSLPRISDFLDRNGLRERVTLIAAGGIRHPGDISKTIALGADGVFLT